MEVKLLLQQDNKLKYTDIVELNKINKSSNKVKMTIISVKDGIVTFKNKKGYFILDIIDSISNGNYYISNITKLKSALKDISILNSKFEYNKFLNQNELNKDTWFGHRKFIIGITDASIYFDDGSVRPIKEVYKL